jgi:hypothetical protein
MENCESDLGIIHAITDLAIETPELDVVQVSAAQDGGCAFGDYSGALLMQLYNVVIHYVTMDICIDGQPSTERRKQQNQ